MSYLSKSYRSLGAYSKIFSRSAFKNTSNSSKKVIRKQRRGDILFKRNLRKINQSHIDLFESGFKERDN